MLDFLDVDKNKLRDLWRKIARNVKQNRCIPVGLWIAPTNTLAKVASKLCKQHPKLNGCHFMYSPADIEKVLWKFPIGDVCEGISDV